MTSMPVTASLHENKSLQKMSLNLAMLSKSFLNIASVTLMRLRNFVLNWLVVLS